MIMPSQNTTRALSGKHVAVTGAAGFLGTYLCRKLYGIGSNVLRIDNRRSRVLDGRTIEINFQDEILPLNIADAEVGNYLLKNSCDTIFHLAGSAYAASSVSDPAGDFEANLRTTVAFLETLRKIEFSGCVIFTSSAAVYGEPCNIPITEITPVAPISLYGLSKLSSEKYLSLYAKLYGFQCVIARLFSLYGPGQRKQVVFDLAQKALSENKQIVVLGDGSEIRDFMYVEDAAAALLHLACLPADVLTTVNVCSGEGITIRDLAEKITGLARGNTDGILFSGERRTGDPLTWIGSSKTLSDTGFQSTVDIELGLRLTVEWCREDSGVGSFDPSY
jgi:UDP-glucose 4-epimerase